MTVKIIKKVVVDKADRLYQLPPDLSSFIPGQQKSEQGRKIPFIDLATFHWPIAPERDSDIPASSLAPVGKERIAELCEELANWYGSFHGVKINPEKEIYIGPSITDLLWQLALAFIDTGDIVFVPDLGVPLYRRLTTACGGQPVNYMISARKSWTPDFERINTRLGRVARILFLNSPHNPTGAELSEKEFADLIWIAARENIALVNDAAYATLSGRKPLSLLAVSNGKKVGIEVGSFSYMFGLPPLPVGFAIGNREIISGLKLASKLFHTMIPDYFIELILEGIHKFPNTALSHLQAELTVTQAEAVRLLEIIGLEKAGFDTVPYLWAKIPRRRHATTVSAQLFRMTKIQTIPGVAFGNSGEGYLRFSLTAPVDNYRTAQERVKRKIRFLKLSKVQ